MIDDLASDESARAIVIAVRDLAAALSLEVVVEGVEHREQADVLRTLGLTHVQGFYFARPESADEFFSRISGATQATCRCRRGAMHGSALRAVRLRGKLGRAG